MLKAVGSQCGLICQFVAYQHFGTNPVCTLWRRLLSTAYVKQQDEHVKLFFFIMSQNEHTKLQATQDSHHVETSSNL